MGWTAPICERCWVPYACGQNHGEWFEPGRIIGDEEQTCVFCGEQTSTGIYGRIHPKSQKFPADD